MTIRQFDSSGSDYQLAFRLFLDHTDQKVNARSRLDALVAALPRRRVFIDAGAGDGRLTAGLAPGFDRTVALEPNPHLCAELTLACPTARVVGSAIVDFRPDEPADFVLCSHVLPYIPRDRWQANLSAAASWLAPGGLLAVLVQNRDTDCMNLLHRFRGLRYDLAAAGEMFRAARGDEFDVRRLTDAACIAVGDLDTACRIAEFLLNVGPMTDPPPMTEVREHLATRCGDGKGGIRLSCDQDFLLVRRR